jgi:hypothetical protein
LAAAQPVSVRVSLDLAGRAQVVVGDYNYAFDPWVALAFGPRPILGPVLVIDDPQPGRPRARLPVAGFPRTGAAPARAAASTAVHERLAAVAGALAELIESEVDGALVELPPGDGALEVGLPEDRLWRLRAEFDAAFVDYLEHQRETRSFSAEDPFVGLYFEVMRFLNGLVFEGGAFSHLAERAHRPPVAHLLQGPERPPGAGDRCTHSTIGLSYARHPSSPRPAGHDASRTGVSRCRTCFVVVGWSSTPRATACAARRGRAGGRLT